MQRREARHRGGAHGTWPELPPAQSSTAGANRRDALAGSHDDVFLILEGRPIPGPLALLNTICRAIPSVSWKIFRISFFDLEDELVLGAEASVALAAD